MESQNMQEAPTQEAVTIEDINNNLITLNNNIVSFGTALIFILSIIVGVILGKVLSLWKR